MTTWYSDTGLFADASADAGSEIYLESAKQPWSLSGAFSGFPSEIILEAGMDIIYGVALDLLDLIPEKFHTSQILVDYVKEAGIQAGSWMTQTRDIVKLLSPNTTTSMTYLRHLGAIIGVEFPPEDETSESEMRKTLEEAVSWYKVKGTYQSILILALVHRLNVNIYDMYTNDYVDFYLTDWWTGPEDTNPSPFDASYYKSPHFGIEIILNQNYTVASLVYLWYPDLLGNLLDKVEETRPVHTVPHYLIRLAPKTDEFGHVIEVAGQIKARIMTDWHVSTTYFNGIGSSDAWFFNDGIFFNQSETTYIKSITKWVLGTGNYPSTISDPGFHIETPVLTGTIDPDNITIDNEKVIFEFIVPKASVATGLSELGLYIPGSSDTFVLGATFPKINKDAQVEIRVVFEVYKTDLS